MIVRPVAQRLSRPCCRLSMPLKAKIIDFNIRSMATKVPKERPGDEPNDVLFSAKSGVRTIELNRPKKLNSLNGSMARKIVPRLLEWQKSQMANVIVIKGSGRAFCAGGDVTALAKQIREEPEQGQREARDYFALEYQLDHLIATYTKPYVAFMDGITMGGGVGLSIHAPFRIATENTVFAMPETTIGFFPDVGATFFLPKMEGGLGMYLALTSEQLKGADVFYAGLGTHYLDSTSLPDLEARLSELEFKDYDTLSRRIEFVNATIEEFTTGIPHTYSPTITPDIRRAIDYSFGVHQQSVQSCLDTLTELSKTTENAVPPAIRDWASKTHKTILTRSPTSVAVTFRALTAARDANIAEAFRTEYTIASKFMAHPDFAEGVTARLVTKTPPKWSPDTLDQVSDSDVDAFFSLPKNAAGLELLHSDSGDEAYTQYPYAKLTSLPDEDTVRDLIRGKRFESIEAVVQHFLKTTGSRMGVREKVSEILTRKAGVSEGTVYWQD